MRYVRTFACMGAVLLAAGCSPSDPKPEPTDCAPGRRGCPCRSEARCDANLSCLDGFCAPVDCERGARDCACNPDGTCATYDDKPLSCLGNLCVLAGEIEPGALGGACGDATACAAIDSGTLTCIDGVCELAGCPSGRLGCPCGPLGFCAAFDGRPARCLQGLCALGACQPGSAGCSCKSGSRCDAGLVCDGVCRYGDRAALVVGDAAARACDVVVKVEGGPAPAVVFGPAVAGKLFSRPPKLSLSFAGIRDAALDSTVAWFEAQRTGASGAPALTILSARCYDRGGRPLADPSVILQ